MSFREKSAWISLFSILLVTAIYFLRGRDLPAGLGVLYCFAAFMAIEIVGHLFVALRSPRDARAPKDERERLINLKATRIAAYVYVTGSFLAVSTIHLGAHGHEVARRVVLALVVAQVFNYSARIVYHRRGV